MSSRSSTRLLTSPGGWQVASITFSLTGEVATNSGARTYPVAYSYDYFGQRRCGMNLKELGRLAGGIDHERGVERLADLENARHMNG